MLSSEMRMVLESLDADIPKALERLNHNEALYQKLLMVFCKSNAEAPAQYCACIVADEIEPLLRMVHDLKSSAGNLGLMELYDMAVDFELAIKTTNTIDKKTAEALVAKFEFVLQAIAAV